MRDVFSPGFPLRQAVLDVGPRAGRGSREPLPGGRGHERFQRHGHRLGAGRKRHRRQEDVQRHWHHAEIHRPGGAGRALVLHRHIQRRLQSHHQKPRFHHLGVRLPARFPEPVQMGERDVCAREQVLLFRPPVRHDALRLPDGLRSGKPPVGEAGASAASPVRISFSIRAGCTCSTRPSTGNTSASCGSIRTTWPPARSSRRPTCIPAVSIPSSSITPTASWPCPAPWPGGTSAWPASHCRTAWAFEPDLTERADRPLIH